MFSFIKWLVLIALAALALYWASQQGLLNLFGEGSDRKAEKQKDPRNAEMTLMEKTGVWVEANKDIFERIKEGFKDFKKVISGVEDPVKEVKKSVIIIKEEAAEVHERSVAELQSSMGKMKQKLNVVEDDLKNLDQKTSLKVETARKKLLETRDSLREMIAEMNRELEAIQKKK